MLCITIFLVLILYVSTQDNKDAANARILMRLAASSQFVTFWKINDFRYGVIEQIFEHMDGNENALVCMYILNLNSFLTSINNLKVQLKKKPFCQKSCLE